jgi:dihydrodipicolinate synthase/N-acetylneuraminate lyase
MGVLTSKGLKGIWATLLLPLHGDDSIDFACFKNDLDFILEAGVSGVYTNGTAGEFYNQTEEEFDMIQSLVAENCSSKNIPFQVGASHGSPPVCIERIKRSKKLQPDAYQIIFPDWLPLIAEEQIQFLNRVADIADPVPLVLYNPGHSKTLLKPEDFSRLQKEVPQLIGIKVAAKDDAWFRAMELHGSGLSVFIQGHRLASGFKAGIAKGSYSNIACLNPVGAVAWYRLMQEDIAEALVIENRILAFFETCIFPFAKAGYSDPALDKLLAFAGGWTVSGTRLRWPYKCISEKEALSVRKQAKKMLPAILTKI